jgi:hypothetical protein
MDLQEVLVVDLPLNINQHQELHQFKTYIKLEQSHKRQEDQRIKTYIKLEQSHKRQENQYNN